MKKAIEEGARLEQEANVAPKDYTGMVEHMANSKSPCAEDTRPAKKSRTQKTAAEKDKEKESPERVVEEWTYINHDSKIGPATIYFNKTVDNHNVIFLSFEPTPWHGEVTLLENEIMVIRFNCRGDTANLHTAMVRKLGKDL